MYKNTVYSEIRVMYICDSSSDWGRPKYIFPKNILTRSICGPRNPLHTEYIQHTFTRFRLYIYMYKSCLFKDIGWYQIHCITFTILINNYFSFIFTKTFSINKIKLQEFWCWYELKMFNTHLRSKRRNTKL